MKEFFPKKKSDYEAGKHSNKEAYEVNVPDYTLRATESSYGGMWTGSRLAQTGYWLALDCSGSL